MRRAKTLFAVSAALVGLIVLGLQHRTIASVSTDPTGQYRAVTSFKTYMSVLPMAPGSSSDKPCFVKILRTDGTSLGEIPVPTCQLADVEWSAAGARIKRVGEWDFARRTCFYWSEDGDDKVFVN